MHKKVVNVLIPLKLHVLTLFGQPHKVTVIHYCYITKYKNKWMTTYHTGDNLHDGIQTSLWRIQVARDFLSGDHVIE